MRISDWSSDVCSSDLRIYARGPKAAGAVHSMGLEVVARSGSERLRDCIDLVIADLEPGDRVVLQRDGGPPPSEAQRLRAHAAEVVEVPIYTWQATLDDPRPAERLAEGVIGGRVHAVTFTSGPQIGSWFQLAAGAGLEDALRARLVSGEVVIGCVGPRSEEHTS